MTSSECVNTTIIIINNNNDDDGDEEEEDGDDVDVDDDDGYGYGDDNDGDEGEKWLSLSKWLSRKYHKFRPLPKGVSFRINARAEESTKVSATSQLVAGILLTEKGC